MGESLYTKVYINCTHISYDFRIFMYVFFVKAAVDTLYKYQWFFSCKHCYFHLKRMPTRHFPICCTYTRTCKLRPDFQYNCKISKGHLIFRHYFLSAHSNIHIIVIQYTYIIPIRTHYINTISIKNWKLVCTFLSLRFQLAHTYHDLNCYFMETKSLTNVFAHPERYSIQRTCYKWPFPYVHMTYINTDCTAMTSQYVWMWTTLRRYLTVYLLLR